MKEYAEIVQDTKVLLKDYYEAMSNKDYSKACELALEIKIAGSHLFSSAYNGDGEIELDHERDRMMEHIDTALRKCGFKKVTD